MAYGYTTIAAAPVADADGYVTSANMKVGTYTLAATVPTFGARHVTCTRAVVGAADTAGTIAVVGKDLSGQTITESLTPGANGILVTGTKFFASVASVTGVGWVINEANDTITVGWDAVNAVATSGGVLHAVTINTTAAGIITIADAAGTIAVLPASVAVGSHFVYDVNFTGYLRVEPAAASNITVIHSGSMPGTAYP